MQGHSEVVQYLNTLLAGELAARDQYFIHAGMCEDWGYARLHAHGKHEMEEETAHAQSLIARILLLGGVPTMVPAAVRVGADVPQMLRNDLQVEMQVRDALREGIALCERHQDYVSRDLLLAQLKDTEEDHARWLEQQLSLIEQMGLPNYLQSQAS